MKVITQKRHSMIPQIEASHVGAMTRLRTYFDARDLLAQEALNRVDTVEVRLSERMGTRAGYASLKAFNNKYTTFGIKLNARLLAINPDELIPTYLHEFAHIVANLVYNKNVGHGQAWRDIMRHLGLTADRCHKMDVSAFAKPKKKFFYDCMVCDRRYGITPSRHRKQQHHVAKGSWAYRCKCGGSLEHIP